MSPSSVPGLDADLIVIGAGPAGLFAGLRAATHGLRVLILEKNARAGRKLLVTGSGKCNLTNTAPLDVFLSSYGGQSRFVKPALLNLPNTALMAFFSDRGFPLEELHAGKVFPASMRSADVLDFLLSRCGDSGSTLRCSCPVLGVRRTEEGFSVDTPAGAFTSRFLLISTGGASFHSTGSTGDGYALARSLGHTLVPHRPALTPVIPLSYDCSGCAGIALPGAELSLWRAGKKVLERTGDLLFTHRGLSGPAILDASRDFLPGDEIRVHLAAVSSPAPSDIGALDAEFLASCAASPKKSLKNLLSGFSLPEALSLVLLSRAGISADTTASSLDRSRRRLLVENLWELRFTIGILGGLDEAMATAGGVETSEVQSRTMESRLVPGLYFAGEVLDVDGDTGGFNLQFAFSSGALAADSMARR